MQKQFIKNNDPKTTFEEYLKILSIKPVEEIISATESYNRVTSKPVFANIPSPFYHSCAMDGIAVKSNSTHNATEKFPVKLYPDRDYIFVDTGNPLPENMDSVIMIEDIVKCEDNSVKIFKSSHPWQHVRMAGEDIIPSQLILKSDHRIRPADIGALVSSGIEKLNVYKIPSVGIIPTGSEIIENPHHSAKGKIIDSNSWMISALCTENHAIHKRYSPIIDNLELLENAIKKSVLENDITLIIAGSSAGRKDLTVHLIEKIGEVCFHGLSVKPGKPTIFGRINNKPVIGLPGYPASAFLVFLRFVVPIIQNFTNTISNSNKELTGFLTKQIVSSTKNEEMLRVTIANANNKTIISPLSTNAGSTMSLLCADGILTIPKNCEGINSGTEVTVKLINNDHDFSDRLVIIGSHDILLEHVSLSVPLISTHTGSFGGIIALKKNECHIAPIHLLDESSGEYNLSSVKKYFPNQKMALIHGVKRIQGWIVQKDNPHNIGSVKDIITKKLNYANRQKGSGTRILFDFLLKNENLRPEEIINYDLEFTNHLSVAMAVSSKTADTGLGVYSSAKALNLDFIPVYNESYEFLTFEENLKEKPIINFINYLRSESFKKILNDLGGYDTINTGKITIIGEDNA